MAKPLILRKVGSKWEILLDVRAARAFAPSRAQKKLTKYPSSAMVPVVRTGERSIDLVDGGSPARFATKDEAKGIAESIGRYMLQLGDFTYTYIEEQRGGETERDPRRRRITRRRKR